MNVVSKLSLYGLALAGSFGVATAVGAAVGPINVTGHSVHAVVAADPGSGAAVTDQAVSQSTSGYVANVDGYQVTRSGGATNGSEWSLNFGVSSDGQQVRTDPYLGEAGHLVAIRQADFAYLHLHPLASSSGTISFSAHFPSAGVYRLYLDFSAGGNVHTALFTIDVPDTMAHGTPAGGVAPTDTTGHPGH